MNERLAQVAPELDLTSFIRRFRTDIVTQWSSRLPADQRRLVDIAPDLLDELAELADTIVNDGVSHRDLEGPHSLARIAADLSLSDIVAELSALRDTLLLLWEREFGRRDVVLVRALHLALDHAIALAVERRVDSHDQTLAALDRVSAAAFESSTLEELLGRLLQELVHALPWVDTAAILLRDGDDVYTRAAIGAEDEVAAGYSEAIGEGFGGRIAATREPLELRVAHSDPLVRSEALRQRKVLALVGAPLIQSGHVIGVAYVGSMSSHELSPDHRQRFLAMAARATGALHHHLLRTELTRSEERFKRIAAEREIALAKLENLLAASPVGIGFLDLELRYVRINDALAAINDRSPAAHLGRTVREVLPQLAPGLEPLLRGVLETGRSLIDLQLEPPSTEGSPPRTFLVSYFPVRSPGGITFGVGTVVTEITELERARKELERSRVMLESIIEHAPSGIYVKDETGVLVLANQGVAASLDQPLDDVVGRRNSDLMPAVAAEEIAATDRAVIDDKRSLEVEEVVPTATGERTFLSTKFPVPGPDGRTWVCGISTDITERKRMENDLRDAIRAREDLLAMVSHDMRNPLGTITLATTMVLADAELSTRSRRHGEMIERSAHALARLIDDLLDLAAVQVGRIALHLNRVLATTLVVDAVEGHASLAAERGIQISATMDPIAGIELSCDSDRIQRIFANLIGNALKFCQPGDRVEIAAILINGAVQFSVNDSGPGIDHAMIPYLFDPYRSAPEHARRGVGLGLFISKSMVAAHGGKMWVASEQGGGATFFFTLPAG